MNNLLCIALCMLALYTTGVQGENAYYSDQTSIFGLNEPYLEDLSRMAAKLGKNAPNLTIYINLESQEGYIDLCGNKMLVQFVPYKYRAPDMVWLGTHEVTGLNLYVPKSAVEKSCGFVAE